MSTQDCQSETKIFYAHDFASNGIALDYKDSIVTHWKDVCLLMGQKEELELNSISHSSMWPA